MLRRREQIDKKSGYSSIDKTTSVLFQSNLTIRIIASGQIHYNTYKQKDYR